MSSHWEESDSSLTEVWSSVSRFFLRSFAPFVFLGQANPLSGGRRTLLHLPERVRPIRPFVASLARPSCLFSTTDAPFLPTAGFTGMRGIGFRCAMLLRWILTILRRAIMGRAPTTSRRAK